MFSFLRTHRSGAKTSSQLESLPLRTRPQNANDRTHRPRTCNSRFRMPADKTTRQVVVSVGLTIIILAASFGITSRLIQSEVNQTIALQDPPPRQISLMAKFLNIDDKAQSITVEWYPSPVSSDSCENEQVVDIFTDPNLFSSTDGTSLNDMKSSAAPTVPIFRFNSSDVCSDAPSSASVFRTTLNLIMGIPNHRSTSGQADKDSIQAYPFDEYFLLILMWARLANTNESVGISFDQSFGTPINFELKLDTHTSVNNAVGLQLLYTVSRSTGVKALVIIIVVANWLVTIAFLWITVASFMWDHAIVAEMFVVPIATLFAFTSVRANLPGAPTGFGAVVDYYGILPNLALITLFSAILLLQVLYRRVLGAANSGANMPVVMEGAPVPTVGENPKRISPAIPQNNCGAACQCSDKPEEGHMDLERVVSKQDQT
ncbi:hypothetical protein R3P38DRAFT_3358150 [Favolaschia claudopus]|uniref:Uncharacterized protein n=1 Tax=Favolaschia claudopus TaxID=2862362 RepID=A0AAW0B3V2_9AGAR